MKNYLLPIMSIFVVLALLVGCAITKLENYKATSTDEEEIIQVITRAQNAWNQFDENEFIAGFCSEGVFAHRVKATEMGVKRKASKDKISTIFSASHTTMGYYDFENPKISITGDKANFTAENSSNTYPWPSKLLLLRENGKWCIDDWDFNLHF